MNKSYNHHYIRVREDMAITHGFSDAFMEPQDSDILLNDKGGYQFRLFADGEENPNLYSMDNIPLYRWTGSEVVVRTEEEIAADRATMEKEHRTAETERIANATETVLLELAAEHEERLCMLEMGVTNDDL